MKNRRPEVRIGYFRTNAFSRSNIGIEYGGSGRLALVCCPSPFFLHMGARPNPQTHLSLRLPVASCRDGKNSVFFIGWCGAHTPQRI